MASSPPASEAPAANPDLTLGALLYADPAKQRVSEAAWVALVAAVAASDPRALQRLYQRMHRLVFTLAVRITGSRTSAEEVTLDVFHEIWRRASDYNPVNGTVIGWIMNIARSRAIDRVRHEGRQKRDGSAVAPETETTTADADADPVERHQAAARLRTAMSGLSQPERDAIELAYFSDSTYSEVARRLNEPLGTIKTRIRAGLAKLRSALTGEGLP